MGPVFIFKGELHFLIPLHFGHVMFLPPGIDLLCNSFPHLVTWLTMQIINNSSYSHVVEHVDTYVSSSSQMFDHVICLLYEKKKIVIKKINVYSSSHMIDLVLYFIFQ